MKKENQELTVFKDSIKRINIKQEMLKDVKQNVSSYQKKHKGAQKMAGMRRFVTIAATILAVTLIGVPVSAKVQSLLKWRMEQVPQEKVNSMVENLDKQQTESDLYSREFTESESALLSDLDKQYHQGRFPENEIKQISDSSEIDPEKVCYLTTTGCYYFPKREMTEEELLEYLDFQQTLAYGLEERSKGEVTEEGKKMEEARKENVNQIVGTGGVDIKEATEIAQKWMDRMYPGVRDGMEENAYLFTSEKETMEIFQENIKYKNLYAVNFSVIHDYYYFMIDADTGKLASFLHSTSDMVHLDNPGITQQETEQIITEYLPNAREQLKNVFGIEEYEKAFAFYSTVSSGMNKDTKFSYHFVTENGDDYILVYLIKTGEMVEYRDTIYADYMKLLEELEQERKERPEDYEERSRHKVELKK